MDILLSKVTQQAMNYAIRSGIVITSSYAMKQCSRLVKSVDNAAEKQELASLQMRLESKIRIISPAIDMIELISARGNTSLESAVTLTKSLRWDIQSLGVRLAKAVGEEELQRRGSSRAQSRAQNEVELKLIIADIKKLLARIEDAVPLINLAITTSGANLSSSLPSTVSPSRLLQASTFLTAGDTQYSIVPANAVQIGPTFTLSLYMLFSGHIRPQDEEGIRETTWKEVIHKARVRLMRVPLDRIWNFPSSIAHQGSNTHGSGSIPASEGKSYEFAYQLLIVEDLDDDRVHSYEEDETQPGPFEGVDKAGIREIVPIHEISKIFYADTGKILNIGTDGETNNPILLLKRDINAIPPRRMMERQTEQPWYEDDEEEVEVATPRDDETAAGAPTEDEQSEIDAQLFRETSRAPESAPEPEHQEEQLEEEQWRFPPNLDPEWMAFEVYVEEPDSDEEEESAAGAPTPQPFPSSPPDGSAPDRSQRAGSLDPRLTAGLSNLNLRTPSPAPPNFASPPGTALQKRAAASSLYEHSAAGTPGPSSVPAIRTSLSLLEMLVRLTALQQFQQSSHLAIPDELLTFFLSESASTVGAGSDAELRRRVRRDAVRRVGFDPYDESPIKRRGEEYLEREMHGASEYGAAAGSRQGSPYPAGGVDESYIDPDSGIAERAAGAFIGFDAGAGHASSSTFPSSGPRAPELRSSSYSPHRGRHHNHPGVSGSTNPTSPLPHRDVPLPSREVGGGGRETTPGPSSSSSTAVSPSPLLRKATRPPGTSGAGRRQSAFGGGM